MHILSGMLFTVFVAIAFRGENRFYIKSVNLRLRFDKAKNNIINTNEIVDCRDRKKMK